MMGFGTNAPPAEGVQLCNQQRQHMPCLEACRTLVDDSVPHRGRQGLGLLGDGFHLAEPFVIAKEESLSS